MASSPEKRIEASHFSPDTLEFIRLLEKYGVRYLIVEGEAVIFHGYARFTGDVDFFYSLEAGNSERLFSALEEFWSGDIPAVASPKDLEEAGYILQFGRAPSRIDLLNSVDGIGFDEAWETRETVTIEGAAASLTTQIIGLKTLIQNKRASGRPKDLDDLAFLQKALGK